MQRFFLSLQKPVHPILQDIVVDMKPWCQRDRHRPFDRSRFLLMILREVENQMGVLQLHVFFGERKVQKTSP